MEPIFFLILLADCFPSVSLPCRHHLHGHIDLFIHSIYSFIHSFPYTSIYTTFKSGNIITNYIIKVFDALDWNKMKRYKAVISKVKSLIKRFNVLYIVLTYMYCRSTCCMIMIKRKLNKKNRSSKTNVLGHPGRLLRQFWYKEITTDQHIAQMKKRQFINAVDYVAIQYMMALLLDTDI